MGLVMLVFYGGRERRIDEFRALAAPHQLVLDTVTTLTDQRCLLELRLPPAGELKALQVCRLNSTAPIPVMPPTDRMAPGHAGVRRRSFVLSSSLLVLRNGSRFLIERVGQFLNADVRTAARRT
jgi:hypothetical protein